MLLVSTTQAANQMFENMLVLIYTTQSIHRLPVVNLDKASICGDRKTSFSFWQKRKIGNLYISGYFADSSGGHKGRCHLGSFTPDQERSHVCITENMKVKYNRLVWIPALSYKIKRKNPTKSGLRTIRSI